MLRATVFAGALLLPMLASAASHPTDWLTCETDYDCTVVQGTCGPAVVNVGLKEQAEVFFRKNAKESSCVPRFWQPKPEGSEARCRLQRCELVGKEIKK